MTTPAEGLARLRSAAASGALDELGACHGLRVITVFGSAGRGESIARDLDVGVLYERDCEPDLLTLIAELAELAGTDVDLAHLNRAGPVLRERATVGAVWLFESEPGAVATLMAAAVGERIDTDPARRLDLELLAE